MRNGWRWTRVTTRNLGNPLTSARDAWDRERLGRLFPSLGENASPSGLSLRPYLDGCPERFFNRDACALVLEWLMDRDARQRAELQAHLAGAEMELSAALHFLRQVNHEDWHDRPLLEGEDFEVVRFIDAVLHPAYLRMTEGVLAHLVRPFAHFSRIDRGKSPEGLDVFNAVEELSSSSLAPLVGAYNKTVRNAIGHGGIAYGQKEIRYSDKKTTITLDVWSVVRMVDDMVDTCNGIAAALKLFLLRFDRDGYLMPRELAVEELMEETSTPWWTIGGCIPTELPGATQLLIYARPESRDAMKINWAAIQSAVVAEGAMPGYDRYFLSLRGSRGDVGWAAFDGDVLRSLRESGAADLHEYVAALESPGVFYHPELRLPGLLRRADTLFKSMSLQWPIAINQIRQNLRVTRVAARSAKLHRNGWRSVVNGAVVIEVPENEDVARVVRRRRRQIVRVAARLARRSMSRLDPVRYLPVGWARIAVVNEDFRRRRLGSFGLGPELVCTVQLQRIRRIKAPDIMGSTVEASLNWRIAWNKAWIDEIGPARADDTAALER